jgi:DNA polymerase III subunit epsilon
MLLLKDTFICVDCETTGLDVEKDSIIEVAVSRFKIDNVLESYETLINPLVPIPKESTDIHHITDDMVQDKPTVEMILPDVLKFIGRTPIVGHGVGFDIKIIAEAAKRHNIPCTITNNTVIDTLRLARLYGHSPTNSLEMLRQHFNIGMEGAHRAMADVTVNIQVFKQLSKQFKTTEQMLQRLSRPIAMKNMPLGKHKGRPFKEVPLNYLLWARHQGFDGDLLFSINQEVKKRQKGSHFSQSSNPFSNL